MHLTLFDYRLEALFQEPLQQTAPEHFTVDTAETVHRFHTQLPGYQPTRLVDLASLAQEWGVGKILVKDESSRFDLKAFKVLGGSYAVARLISQMLSLSSEQLDYSHLVSSETRKRLGPITLTTATDGNHGRGIAWTAQQLGQQAVIYMPQGSAASRVNSIRSHGATVEVTELNYDDSVRVARKSAEQDGWYIIQDTSWDGYETIPLWIMQGYLTMCGEVASQMQRQNSVPTHVFIQAGVGALAGSVIGYFLNAFPDRPPKFIIMEPNSASCIFSSALSGDGRALTTPGDLETIMAGLACGEPSSISWEILRDFSSCYIRCDDYVAANGVRILANPVGKDRPIEAGESGSVGPGLLNLIATNPDFAEIKDRLEIGSDSTVLLFNTEGATDPKNYRDILWYGKYPGNIAASHGSFRT